MAGLSPSKTALAAFNQQLPEVKLNAIRFGKASAADRVLVRSAYAVIDDDLLGRSLAEARAGAKIVVWPEVGTGVLQEDESALIQRAVALAKQGGIYLDLGLVVFLRTGSTPPALDETVLIDPAGTVLWNRLISQLHR